MTPGARVAAAIECLDEILKGEPAERVLTRWARARRFAGSKDRRAIRDHVYTVLRQKRSAAWLGGDETGRGLMIGSLRSAQVDVEPLFNGAGHAPENLTTQESCHRDLSDAPKPVALDWPDWLVPESERSLGPDMDAVLGTLRHRAKPFLRVNTLKSTRVDAIDALKLAAIVAQPHPLSPTALMIASGETRLRDSAAYSEGLVELQDAASQAVTDYIATWGVPQSILDACAGGGGKSLSLAAHFPDARIMAFDADKSRMSDLPNRALRAGAALKMTDSPSGVFDLVVCDVPCSGSGAWARSPEAKWRLSALRLAELQEMQASILDRFANNVAEGGSLAYVTCSLFAAENEDQAAAFVKRNGSWHWDDSRRYTPLDGGDGFFVARLTRK